MLRIAHRGLWGEGVPENSMAAFQAAATRGLGVELDVHLSKDGVPMVFHDATLERMSGQVGYIFERTAEDLGTLHLIGGEGQTIPTLASVLEFMPEGLPIFVEIKPPHKDSPWNAAQTAAQLNQLLTMREHLGLVAMSFSPVITEALLEALPPKMVGFLAAEGALERVEAAKSAQAGFAAVWRDDVKQAREILGADGPGLYTWTIKSATQQAAAHPYVDGVIFEGF